MSKRKAVRRPQSYEEEPPQAAFFDFLEDFLAEASG